MRVPTLVVHAGAGRLPEAAEDPVFERTAREGLEAALAAGAAVLAAGGASLDAVVAAVRQLEDCEVWNAGRGAVLDERGEVALDATVMEGGSRGAGAVAGVRCVANPVDLARAVLRDGRHVLLAGEGAEAFARSVGFDRVDPERHVTSFRRDQLARALARRADRESAGGTVGAVARDADGHLAAATSTGGMTAKRPGRVSDSALIGSGTWADDATCAVSATGHGELFVRAVFAHEVDARMRYARQGLAAACDAALASVRELGGSGGCIAIDAAGRIATPFDTPHMPRGLARVGDEPRIVIHTTEAL